MCLGETHSNALESIPVPVLYWYLQCNGENSEEYSPGTLGTNMLADKFCLQLCLCEPRPQCCQVHVPKYKSRNRCTVLYSSMVDISTYMPISIIGFRGGVQAKRVQYDSMGGYRGTADPTPCLTTPEIPGEVIGVLEISTQIIVL